MIKIGNVYVSEHNYQVLKTCIEINEPVLLIGQTGTGKTSIIKEISQQQSKPQKLIRVSLNGNTSVEEIIGKWLVDKGSTYWQDGVLTTAMKKGHWIVFDEINSALPEILFTLHSLLDDERAIRLAEKDNERVTAHEEFRFFATMNPPDEYAGTKEMNKALLSRFNTVIKVEIPDEGVEVELIQEQTSVTPSQAQRLVTLAQKLREAKKQEKIYYYCSTRDLIHAGKLLKKKVPIKQAVLYSLFNKMTDEEQETLKSILPASVFDETTELQTYAQLKVEHDKLKKQNQESEKEINDLKDKLIKANDTMLEKLKEVLQRT